ncbi:MULTISPECIES: hypothetical protein [unclassified Streptomyces]|uniref:hypothetical protein n=1 Tax=unclassified Streptomyces TaxID=2593676 RepID=UPI0035DBB415
MRPRPRPAGPPHPSLSLCRTCQAALLDDTPQVDAFTSDVLGLWSGWREPVSTALLGDWASPLLSSGSLGPTALDCLRAEARIIHRQLTPVWRRRVAGERLWSLDFRFGDDLTTYDLISGGPAPYEVLAGTLPDDPRVATVLAQLRPIEHAVAMAWASTRVTSWAEAAADVIALDPAQFTGYDPRALGELGSPGELALLPGGLPPAGSDVSSCGGRRCR